MLSSAGFLSMGAILVTACSVLAQSAPAVKPTTPAKQASAEAAIPTLKASARLVVVNVVVTDRHGKPVHGLKASDFTLSESGVPQGLKHFEEHSAISPVEAAKL